MVTEGEGKSPVSQKSKPQIRTKQDIPNPQTHTPVPSCTKKKRHLYLILRCMKIPKKCNYTYESRLEHCLKTKTDLRL